MIKAIRVFYRKSDGKVIWSHQLVCPDGYDGKFPTTIEQNIEELPDKPQLDATGSVILDANENPFKLGGVPDDYACIEVTDQLTISAFVASDSNTVVNGKLVTGTPRPIVIPEPPRDLAKEVDELKDMVKELESKVKE